MVVYVRTGRQVLGRGIQDSGGLIQGQEVFAVRWRVVELNFVVGSFCWLFLSSCLVKELFCMIKTFHALGNVGCPPCFGLLCCGVGAYFGPGRYSTGRIMLHLNRWLRYCVPLGQLKN